MPMDLNLIVEHLTQEKNVLIGEAEKLEHSSKMLLREAKMMEEEAKRLRKESLSIREDAISMHTRAEKIDEEIQKLREYCEWISPDKSACETLTADDQRRVRPAEKPPPAEDSAKGAASATARPKQATPAAAQPLKRKRTRRPVKAGVRRKKQA